MLPFQQPQACFCVGRSVPNSVPVCVRPPFRVCSDDKRKRSLLFILLPTSPFSRQSQMRYVQVRCMAKRAVRVAAMTASTSELITTVAARGAIRGLGDRIRFQRQRAGGGGGGSSSRDVRWVTVYVGVGRCDAVQPFLYCPLSRPYRSSPFNDPT